MAEARPVPTTEKELLAATVKATAKLFKKSAEVKRIEEQIKADAARELAQESARTIGETSPEGDT